MLPYVVPFLLIVGVTFADEESCVKRYFDQNSFVCVCNEDHCDFYDTLEPLPTKEAYLVTSNKADKRLERQKIFFQQPSSEINKDGHLEFLVQQDREFQTILGFGGAFTDAAGRNIAKMSDKLQEDILSSYYTKSGLGYNLGRTNMGGCDFSVRGYTYDDVPGDVDLVHFNLTEDDLVYKIPFMKRAREMTNGNLKLFASPWSAPAWMKTNNDLIGKGDLKAEYYQVWANYFLKFLDAYKAEAIDFWGLTANNEPTNGQYEGFKFNCMGWNSQQQKKWVVENIGPLLKSSQYKDVKFMILDDQRPLAAKWVKSVLEDGAADKYVDGVAVHWYADMVIPSPSPLDIVHEEFPNKFILYTEACTGSRPNEVAVALGSWERAEEYLHNIIEDMNHWVVGWTDWNLVLDRQGGPNWANNFVDAPIIINEDNQEFYRQPMYYALAHITKYVPAGSKRIALTPNGIAPKTLDSVAFTTPDGSTVVLLVNRDANETMSINVRDSDRGILKLEVTPASFVTVVFW